MKISGRLRVRFIEVWIFTILFCSSVFAAISNFEQDSTLELLSGGLFLLSCFLWLIRPSEMEASD